MKNDQLIIALLETQYSKRFMKDELGVPVSNARSWNEMLLILEDFGLLGEGFSLRVKQTSV